MLLADEAIRMNSGSGEDGDSEHGPEDAPLLGHAAAPAASTAALRDAADTTRYAPVDGQNSISLPVSEFPTCNYDACENASYREYKETTYKKGGARHKALKWALVLITGVCTALTAYFIDITVETLTRYKNSSVIDRLRDSPGDTTGPFLHLVFINLGFVSVAAFLVALAPCAGGSGIPEVKCYLNGLRLPQVLSLRTLVAKALGVLFSVSGGLPCGKEGPMIHSGAILASGITQGMLPVPGATRVETWLHKLFLPFRTDKHKRDFISCGAAAGVAAAFGAPVGGVLFALEEGCSFWDVELTWRIFFGSMLCAFTMALLTGASAGQNSLNAPGMIDFGDFSGEKVVPFTPVEVPWFIFIGVLGGLLGAAFNAANMKITEFRRFLYGGGRGTADTGHSAVSGGAGESRVRALVRGYSQKHRGRAMKFAEALLVSLCVSCTVWFCVGALPAQCSTGERTSVEPSGGSGKYEEDYVCEPGCCVSDNSTQVSFNTMATLQLNSPSKTLRLLFHFRGTIHTGSLLLHGAFYVILMAVTYGVAVPSGLFVPSLVTGAVLGRIAGQTIQHIPYHTFQNLHPGAYALVGSAAFLAGVCRLTFSLAVILIEATRDIAYALPLMLAIMTAKLVGDMFNHGIYDAHIAFRKLAFLEHTVPRHLVRNTVVSDFMTTRHRLVVFAPVESVATIVEVLRRRAFCAIPVCHDHLLGGHDGLMTRSRLLALLDKRPFVRTRPVLVERTALERMDGEGLLVDYPDAAALLASLRDGDQDRVPAQVVWSLQTQAAAAAADSARGASVHGRERRTLPVEARLGGDEALVRLPAGALHDAPSSPDMIPWNEFNYPYTDYRELQGEEGLRRVEARLTADDLRSFVDLRPYMNPQPFLVPDSFSLARCYKLFRSVGMRHMLVIGSDHRIAGIVTRYDLWNRLQLLVNPPEGYANVRGQLVKVVDSPPLVDEDAGVSSSAFPDPLVASLDVGGSEFAPDLHSSPHSFNPNF